MMVKAGRHLPVLDERPRTRGECVGDERPCPWVGCRHHMFLRVSKDGRIFINGIASEHDEDSIAFRLRAMKDTCALDVADRGRQLTQEEVAELLGTSQPNVDADERVAMDKMRVLMADDHPEDSYIAHMAREELKREKEED